MGESDAEGRYVKSRPVYPWDLWESVYQLMGIDPNDRLPNPDGCVAYVSPATACSYAAGRNTDGDHGESGERTRDGEKKG